MASDTAGSCEPNVNWSGCEDSSGYPAVLPAFYLTSALAFGAQGVVYVTSIVKTLQMQLRDKNRVVVNTAVQMHIGIIAYSVTGTCNHAVRLYTSIMRVYYCANYSPQVCAVGVGYPRGSKSYINP